MTNDDVKKLADVLIPMVGVEMERVLEPVFEDLDEIKKIQKEHTEKIDALTADVLELQRKADTTNDGLNIIDEKFEKNNKEHDQIRKHINLPTAARD